MATHRFWRLHISAKGINSVNYVALSGLVLADVAGGPQVAVGGVASASSIRTAGEEADKAFDALQNTFWRGAYNYVLPEHLQYDMGEGNAIDVVEIRLVHTTTPDLRTGPKDIALLYSDDGKHWFIQAAWSDLIFTNGVEIALDAMAKPANLTINRAIKPIIFRNTAAIPGEPALRKINRFGVFGCGFRHYSAAQAATPYTGNYFIQGSTTGLGEPLARRIDLYEQSSGLLVRRAFSGADGAFRFDNIADLTYSVVGVDVGAEQNSVIYAHVTPALMT